MEINSLRGVSLMYEENQDPIESLVHLYVDGAFNRRELIRRVAGYTGSVAAAVAAVAAVGGSNLANADDTAACAIDASVPADAPDLTVADIQFPGDAGPIFGHLAYPLGADAQVQPGVIVVHENRGLVD